MPAVHVYVCMFFLSLKMLDLAQNMTIVFLTYFFHPIAVLSESDHSSPEREERNVFLAGSLLYMPFSKLPLLAGILYRIRQMMSFLPRQKKFHIYPDELCMNTLLQSK